MDGAFRWPGRPSKRSVQNLKLHIEPPFPSEGMLDWRDCQPDLDGEQPAWGVPHWNLPDRYPRFAGPARWAWEFLRRNHRYRRVWHEHCGPRFNENWEVVYRNETSCHWWREFGLSAPSNPRSENGVVRFDYTAVAKGGQKIARLRGDKYCEYLRIIDGLDSGATLAQIFRVLYPNHADKRSAEADKALRYKWKRALALRDSEYPALASRRPIAVP